MACEHTAIRSKTPTARKKTCLGEKMKVNTAKADCCFLNIGILAAWLLSTFHFFLVFLYCFLFFTEGLSDLRWPPLWAGSPGAEVWWADLLIPSQLSLFTMFCFRGVDGCLWPWGLLGLVLLSGKASSPTRTTVCLELGTGLLLQGDVFLQGFK